MLRCAGVKRIGGVCSDVRCLSRHWSALAHYRGDGQCDACGKPALDVLACDACGAIDKHDYYGRFAEREGAPCGRLYEDDEDPTVQILAEDSTDEEDTRAVCAKCKEPIAGLPSWFGLVHKECPAVGFPLVKSPPLRRNYDCACETKVVESFKSYKGYSYEWGRCVTCGGWCKRD